MLTKDQVLKMTYRDLLAFVGNSLINKSNKEVNFNGLPNQKGNKRCKSCNDSTRLISCEDCNHSKDCRSCTKCNYCNKCKRCKSCNHCVKCIDCNDCNNCLECLNCTNCNYCNYCELCTSSEYCFNSKRLVSCVDCVFCEDVRIGWHCANSKNLLHCAFCKDLISEGAPLKFYLANVKLTKKEYEKKMIELSIESDSLKDALKGNPYMKNLLFLDIPSKIIK